MNPVNPIFNDGTAAPAPGMPFDPLAVASSTTPAAPAAAPAAAAPASASAPAQQPVADPGSYKPLNFEVRFPFSSGEVPFDPNLPTLQYPSASRDGTEDAVRKAPNLSIAAGAKLDRYAATIREGLNQIPMSDDQNILRGRETAMFKQEVDVNGTGLGGFVPRFKLREGTKYTGEAARNLVRTGLNLGTVFSVPLWHSGFWMTLRTPSEGDLLELHRQLTQEKTTLGRSTYGLLYSSITSYTAKIMLDFVLTHMHSSSLQLADDDSVVNYIKAPDYQLLLWGLTCATWPNGYQFQRACITDVEKCQYVVTERVNLARLLWEDTTGLTERQKLHMTHKQKQSVTVDQVKIYQEDFLRGRNAKVAINDRLSVTFKMPLLSEYIDVGYKWISMLEEQYGRAMGMREEDRNQYLLNHAQAQAMRQFGHYVHALHLDEHDIEDQDDIAVILGDLSGDDAIRTTFTDKVQAFQNESIIAFVGIPNYKCPSCGGLQNPTALPGRQHELIALDVAQSFFLLLMQKLATIRER